MAPVPFAFGDGALAYQTTSERGVINHHPTGRDIAGLSGEVAGIFTQAGLGHGPMDGGCRAFAEGVARWIGGEAATNLVFVGRPGVGDHVAVEITSAATATPNSPGGQALYLDADGIATAAELIAKMEHIERVPQSEIFPFDETLARQNNILTYDEAGLPGRIAGLLRERLGAFDKRMLSSADLDGSVQFRAPLATHDIIEILPLIERAAAQGGARRYGRERDVLNVLKTGRNVIRNTLRGNQDIHDPMAAGIFLDAARRPLESRKRVLDDALNSTITKGLAANEERVRLQRDRGPVVDALDALDGIRDRLRAVLWESTTETPTILTERVWDTSSATVTENPSLRSAAKKVFAGLLGDTQKPWHAAPLPAAAYSVNGWHGSPHRFDSFDNDAIGSGEGAQAFGHGHYVAGRKGVAEHYRRTLAFDTLVFPDDSTVTWTRMGDRDTVEEKIASALQALNVETEIANRSGARALLTSDVDGLIIDELEEIMDPAAVAASLREKAANEPERLKRYYYDAEQCRGVREAYTQAADALDALIDAGLRRDPNAGHLYELLVTPADDDFLLWDRPIRSQPDIVLERLKAIPDAEAMLFAPQLDEDGAPSGQDLSGEQIYRTLAAAHGGWPAAADVLKGAGIPGIKYENGQSRGRGGEKAANDHNYVIFDGDDLRIVGRDSEAVAELGVDQNHQRIAKYASALRSFDEAKLVADADSVRFGIGGRRPNPGDFPDFPSFPEQGFGNTLWATAPLLVGGAESGFEHRILENSPAFDDARQQLAHGMADRASLMAPFVETAATGNIFVAGGDPLTDVGAQHFVYENEGIIQHQIAMGLAAENKEREFDRQIISALRGSGRIDDVTWNALTESQLNHAWRAQYGELDLHPSGRHPSDLRTGDIPDQGDEGGRYLAEAFARYNSPGLLGRDHLVAGRNAPPLHPDAGTGAERELASRFFQAVQDGSAGIHWEPDKALERRLFDAARPGRQYSVQRAPDPQRELQNRINEHGAIYMPGGRHPLDPAVWRSAWAQSNPQLQDYQRHPQRAIYDLPVEPFGAMLRELGLRWRPRAKNARVKEPSRPLDAIFAKPPDDVLDAYALATGGDLNVRLAAIETPSAGEKHAAALDIWQNDREAALDLMADPDMGGAAQEAREIRTLLDAGKVDVARDAYLTATLGADGVQNTNTPDVSPGLYALHATKSPRYERQNGSLWRWLPPLAWTMSPSEIAADGPLTAHIEAIYGVELAKAYPRLLADVHRLSQSHPQGETFYRISREADPLHDFIGRSQGYDIQEGNTTGSQVRVAVHRMLDDDGLNSGLAFEEGVYAPHELFPVLLDYAVPLELRKLYAPELVDVQEWTPAEFARRTRMAYGHVPDPAWSERAARAAARHEAAVPAAETIADRKQSALFSIQKRESDEIVLRGSERPDDILDEIKIMQVRHEALFSVGAEPDLLDSPAFRSFFGASKIVSPSGAPLVVYHGTPDGRFERFSDRHKGTRSGHAPADVGYHFTDDPGRADAYSRGYEAALHDVATDVLGHAPAAVSVPPAASIVPVVLRMERPLHVGPAETIDRVAIMAAQSEGHDGIVADHGDGREYVVFEPTQIKSIFNTGAWDRADPRIGYALGSHLGAAWDSDRSIAMNTNAAKDRLATLGEAAIAAVAEHGWGSEAQIATQNAFTDALEQVLPAADMAAFTDFALKATVEEMVAHGLERVRDQAETEADDASFSLGGNEDAGAPISIAPISIAQESWPAFRDAALFGAYLDVAAAGDVSEADREQAAIEDVRKLQREVSSIEQILDKPEAERQDEDIRHALQRYEEILVEQQKLLDEDRLHYAPMERVNTLIDRIEANLSPVGNSVRVPTVVFAELSDSVRSAEDYDNMSEADRAEIISEFSNEGRRLAAAWEAGRAEAKALVAGGAAEEAASVNDDAISLSVGRTPAADRTFVFEPSVWRAFRDAALLGAHLDVAAAGDAADLLQRTRDLTAAIDNDPLNLVRVGVPHDAFTELAGAAQGAIALDINDRELVGGLDEDGMNLMESWRKNAPSVRRLIDRSHSIGENGPADEVTLAAARSHHQETPPPDTRFSVGSDQPRDPAETDTLIQAAEAVLFDSPRQVAPAAAITMATAGGALALAKGLDAAVQLSTQLPGIAFSTGAQTGETTMEPFAETKSAADNFRFARPPLDNADAVVLQSFEKQRLVPHDAYWSSMREVLPGQALAAVRGAGAEARQAAIVDAIGHEEVARRRAALAPRVERGVVEGGLARIAAASKAPTPNLASLRNGVEAARSAAEGQSGDMMKSYSQALRRIAWYIGEDRDNPNMAEAAKLATVALKTGRAIDDKAPASTAETNEDPFADSYLGRVRDTLLEALPAGIQAQVIPAEDEPVDDEIVFETKDGGKLPFGVQVGDKYLGLNQYSFAADGEIDEVIDLDMVDPDQASRLADTLGEKISRHLQRQEAAAAEPIAASERLTAEAPNKEAASDSDKPTKRRRKAARRGVEM